MHKTYHLLLSSVRSLFEKPRFVGLDQIVSGRPAVFVANHLGVYGPVLLTAFLPKPFAPWVTHEITEPALCPVYLEGDFVQPVLRLRPPWSGWVAAVLARFCIPMMKEAHAIPVYRGSRKILETINQSVRILENGQNLLIFPEMGSEKGQKELAPFSTGFLRLARTYYLKTRQCINFYPISIQRKPCVISIGPGITYNPQTQFQVEKKRVVNYLYQTIKTMSGSLN